MSRLFESNFDKKVYGEQFYNFFKSFNDKAELIASEFPQDVFGEGKSIFDYMTFNIVDEPKHLVFKPAGRLPNELIERLNNAFKEHHVTD